MGLDSKAMILMRKAKIVTTGLFAAAIILAPGNIANADETPVEEVVVSVEPPEVPVAEVSDTVSQQAQNEEVSAAEDHSATQATVEAVREQREAVQVLEERKAASRPVSNTPSGWINKCISVTGVHRSWYNGLYTIAKRESGFNPRAENGWDSNAAQGYDMRSKGLMQTIGPTFRAYHQPGTSHNIYDPVANCAAAVNYIKATYGSINNVQQANPNLPPKGY